MLTKSEILNPQLNTKADQELVNNPIYEKLLIMYEPMKDDIRNQVQLLFGGTSVAVSPKLIYLHLKYKTPFATQMVSMASSMENFMGGM
jgi:hypothetical protein